MSRFRALLDEVADQANLYDVTDRAVAVARRRRRLQHAIPAVTAAVVLSIVAATAWVPRHHSGPAPATGAMAWLPEKITVPSQAPPLPSTPVGRGALIYDAVGESTASALLVTTTGRQYRLSDVRANLPFIVFGSGSLSPDGRWLVYMDRSGTPYLRNLTGTTRRALPAQPTGLAWSADGHWFAMEPGPTLVDLRTGALKTYHLTCCYSTNGFAVRDDGRLVFTNISVDAGTSDTANEYDVDVVDPAVDWPMRRSITLPKHSPAVGWQVAAGGTRLLVANEGNLTLVDLTTMRILRTYQVPKAQAASPPSDENDTWSVGSLVPEGILLVHKRFTAGVVQTSVELLNLDTGKRRPVSQLPPDVSEGPVLR